MVATKKTAKNAVYMKMLAEKISKYQSPELSPTDDQPNYPWKDKVVNEDDIAEVMNKFKTAYFPYRRKKFRWLELKKDI
jgi:hypothetical protein